MDNFRVMIEVRITDLVRDEAIRELVEVLKRVEIYN